VVAFDASFSVWYHLLTFLLQAQQAKQLAAHLAGQPHAAFRFHMFWSDFVRLFECVYIVWLVGSVLFFYLS
jgi:hypothetical protein